MGEITADTKITIGLVISLIGGVFWLSSLHAQTNSNAQAIERIQVKQKDQDSKIEAILINTTTANAKLDLMLERKK